MLVLVLVELEPQRLRPSPIKDRRISAAVGAAREDLRSVEGVFDARARDVHERADLVVGDLTTRVIREAIDDDVSEPTEQASTKALPEANGA